MNKNILVSEVPGGVHGGHIQPTDYMTFQLALVWITLYVCLCIKRINTVLCKTWFSQMHVAFLDASRAFDRLNHVILLSKLVKFGVPLYIVIPSGILVSYILLGGVLPYQLVLQSVMVFVKVFSHLCCLTFI